MRFVTSFLVFFLFQFSFFFFSLSSYYALDPFLYFCFHHIQSSLHLHYISMLFLNLSHTYTHTHHSVVVTKTTYSIRVERKFATVDSFLRFSFFLPTAFPLPSYYWYIIKTFCVCIRCVCLKLILITIEMRRATPNKNRWFSECGCRLFFLLPILIGYTVSSRFRSIRPAAAPAELVV